MLRISLCLVFLRNSNNNPGHWELSTRGQGPMNMSSETVKGDHVGSLDCRQYSVSKLEVESLPQWISRTSLNFFTRTLYCIADRFSFIFVLFFYRKLLTEWWRHFLGHARIKKKCPQTDNTSRSYSHMLMKGPLWEVRCLSFMLWSSLASSNDVATPAQNSSKISYCQVFVLFICEYHISMLYP